MIWGFLSLIFLVNAAGRPLQEAPRLQSRDALVER